MKNSNTSKKKKSAGAFIFFGVVMMLLYFVVSVSNEPTPEEEGADEQQSIENLAASCARTEIKMNLPTEASAEFPWALNAMQMDDGKYIVPDYFEIQDAPGAPIRRQEYECIIDQVNIDAKTCGEVKCNFLNF